MSRYDIYHFIANEKRRTGLHAEWQKRESHELADNFDLENKQLLEILTSLTNELPEKYRVIFIHHKLLDRPPEEVAEELGVSVRTAERYVSKVMEIIRNHRRRLAFTFLLFNL